MKTYKLPPKTLLLWQCRAILAWLFLTLACSFFSFSLKAFLIAFLILSVILSVVIFLYLPKYHSLCTIKCLKGAVIIENGVIFRNCHILPYSRLIYTQTTITPLSKLFGLRALTLKAARSRVFVPELTEKDALDLISRLRKGDTQ